MNTLKHFKSDEVFLNQEQAARVVRYFFPDQPINPAQVTSSDMAFSQALLIEGIDASTEMGYVEELFDKAFMKAPIDFSIVKDIAKGIAQRAVKNRFRHATGEDLKNPQIYEAVRKKIAVNFRTTWAIRMQTGELDY